MKKKTDSGFKAVICLAVATIAVGVASIAISRMDNAGPIGTGAYRDGVYTAKSTTEDTENYNYVTVTISGGKITNVVWDEITGGASKAELSANGQYIMVEGNPTWKEQSEALGAFVVEHQGAEGLAVSEQGKTDAVSGVSIGVTGFAELLEQALKQAE